jgi:hypothetical protein
MLSYAELVWARLALKRNVSSTMIHHWQFLKGEAQFSGMPRPVSLTVSTCLPVYVSTCLRVYLSTCLPVYLCLPVSIRSK